MKQAIDATETLVKFIPKGCSLSRALKVMSSFLFIGFFIGLSIGLYLKS